MQIRWTRQALVDVEQARLYIASANPRAAARVADDIQETINRLSQYPHLGREGRVEGTREIVVSGTPFIISYRIQDNVVEILGLIHAARRWPDHF